MYNATQTLTLGQIIVDPQLQPRVGGLDTDHIRALQETPEAWPPLLIARRDGQYLLLDGFHRYAAAQNLGLATVAVAVVPLPPDGDLASLAFAANLAHGLPLTLADKRERAGHLLVEQPHVSNLEIARQTALSPTTVAAIRQRLEEAATIAPVEQRMGRRGYTYTVPTEDERAPGDLPPVGALNPMLEALGQAFTSAERIQQRKIAQYLQHLAVALEDQYALDGWETAKDAADACRLALGEERAAALADRLGATSGYIADVAYALGYREEEDEP